LDLAFCFSAARNPPHLISMQCPVARRRKTKRERVGGVSDYKQVTPLGFSRRTKEFGCGDGGRQFYLAADQPKTKALIDSAKTKSQAWPVRVISFGARVRKYVNPSRLQYGSLILGYGFVNSGRMMRAISAGNFVCCL
jgi:hypothetical protein